MSQLDLEGNILRISGALTRKTVVELGQKLLSLTQRSKKRWVIDLRAVDEVDSAGVQLLSSFIKATPKATFGDISTALRQALERIGALRLLEGRN